MADIEEILKANGLSLADVKGKSISQIKKLISLNLEKIFEEEELAKRTKFISNSQKLLPKLKENLKESFEIKAVNVGTGSAPVTVQIVGFVPQQSTFIAYHNDKLYQVKEDDIFKTAEDFEKPITKKTTSKKKSGGKK